MHAASSANIGQSRVRLLYVLLAASVFILDVTVPPGVTGSVLYVAVVLVALNARHRRDAVVVAVACSALAVVGLLLSPDTGSTELWKVITNRCLVVFAIWLILFFGVRRKNVELVAANAQLNEETEQTLRESERRFRQLAENIHEVFWITSSDGEEMIYISPAYEQIWGRSCQSLYENPTNWIDAIHSEDRERVGMAFFQNAAIGQFDERYRIVRPDGSPRWIHDRGFPITNEHGKVYRVAGIAEDITELRLAQDQLMRSARLAAIGQTVAGLTHEGRNALQRSQACLEMLVHRVQDRPKALDLVARIQKAQDHLHYLYEHVREYAAPINLKREACRLDGIVENAWNDLALVRKGRQTNLRKSSELADLKCTVDSVACGQVFRNILENSLGACEDPVEIDVDWTADEISGKPAIRVALRDNGPGLTPEQRIQLFEPFFTTKTKGTGLGLAIAKRLVEAHDGRMDVSKGGRSGTEILVTLPRSGAAS